VDPHGIDAGDRVTFVQPHERRIRVKFLQTIAWKTSRADEMRAVAARFQAENPDPGPGFLGLKMLKDRDQENNYLVIAEFENYDLAMQNSARPEVDAFNKEMMALADGPPSFGNYDVIDEM
jgi:quinol monooxygenase YgiN